MKVSRKARLMSDINVTPFVDVMLVLLVIFMVAAPLMTHGIKIEAPRTSHDKMEMDDKGITISVDVDRRVFINQYELRPDEVAERLPVILDVKHTREVYLKADKSIPYGFIMSLMARIRSAGIENIGMVTEPAVGQKGRREVL
ncbi:ExbD/TolR family protein [Chlorobium limicola]